MARTTMESDDPAAVAGAIARLSTEEITAAVRAAHAPAIIKRAIAALASKPSERLGTILASFDARIQSGGLGRAAREVVSRLGAKVDVTGECPPKGPVMIVTNHPGAYDALALMGSLGGRDDAALVASDRAFLRAMPHLSDHLIFIAEDHPMSRARGAIRALQWLASGRVLVQFGAGMIEPDTRFLTAGDDQDPLGTWSEGTGLLAGRAIEQAAAIVPCFIKGVHSPKAKSLFFVKWAEARGITTIAPLVQATMSGYRDVEIAIRFGSPIDRNVLRGAHDDKERTALIRAAVAKLSSSL